MFVIGFLQLSNTEGLFLNPSTTGHPFPPRRQFSIYDLLWFGITHIWRPLSEELVYRDDWAPLLPYLLLRPGH